MTLSLFSFKLLSVSLLAYEYGKDFMLGSPSVQPSSVNTTQVKNLPKKTYSVSTNIHSSQTHLDRWMRGALRDWLQKGCSDKCHGCLNLKCQRLAPFIAPAGHQSLLKNPKRQLEREYCSKCQCVLIDWSEQGNPQNTERPNPCPQMVGFRRTCEVLQRVRHASLLSKKIRV